mmetsp:Transcript_4527/g.10616  ORF Transcript_4527/g.10616 Transcript_4527/m.10616 type:complete len:325 (-) Transcript_4527:78-1052(-)
MAGTLAARRKVGLQVSTAKTEAPKMEVISIAEGQSFSDLYTLKEEIFDGGHGQVVKAQSAKYGEVVVKIRRKDRFAANAERGWRHTIERILNLQNHVNVLRLHEILEDKEHYYVVMDHACGVELFEFLSTETAVSERECKRIMREVIAGVKSLHDQGMIHRDIKPESIMFDDEAKKASGDASPRTKHKLKLLDFDTCQDWAPDSPKSKSVVGTHGYIAPEAYMGEYSPSSDIWGIGVILYALMTGDLPYDDSIFDGPRAPGDNEAGSPRSRRIAHALKTTPVDYDCDPWPQFPMARDLCQKLLAPEPRDRLKTCDEALMHEWLR